MFILGLIIGFLSFPFVLIGIIMAYGYLHKWDKKDEIKIYKKGDKLEGDMSMLKRNINKSGLS